VLRRMTWLPFILFSRSVRLVAERKRKVALRCIPHALVALILIVPFDPSEDGADASIALVAAYQDRPAPVQVKLEQNEIQPRHRACCNEQILLLISVSQQEACIVDQLLGFQSGRTDQTRLSIWLLVLLAPPGSSWLLLLLFGEPGRARRSQEKPGGASNILLLQSLSASFVTFMLPA